MLNPKSFGLACGVTLALGCFIIGMTSWLFEYGNAIVILMSVVYKGFKVTWYGPFIGAIWGFVDGFIGGFVLAWLYNKFGGEDY